MHGHNVKELGMRATRGDPSLYIRRAKGEGEGRTIGVSGTYVDDAVIAATPDFERIMEATLRRFESKPRVYDSFDFSGTQVSTLTRGSFAFDQEHFASNLCTLSKDASFNHVRRACTLYSWLTHTRPDAACLSKLAVQVTPATFSRDKIQILNKGITRV